MKCDQDRNNYSCSFVFLSLCLSNYCPHYHLLIVILPPLLPCKGAISLTPITTELVDGNFISVVVGFCIAISVTTSPDLDGISKAALLNPTIGLVLCLLSNYTLIICGPKFLTNYNNHI